MVPSGLVWLAHSHLASVDEVSLPPSIQQDRPVPDMGGCLQHRHPCSSGTGCKLNPLPSGAVAKTRSVELSQQALEQLNEQAADSSRPWFNTSPQNTALPSLNPCGLSVPPCMGGGSCATRTRFSSTRVAGMASPCSTPMPTHVLNAPTSAHTPAAPPRNGSVGCKAGKIQGRGNQGTVHTRSHTRFSSP